MLSVAKLVNDYAVNDFIGQQNKQAIENKIAL